MTLVVGVGARAGARVAGPVLATLASAGLTAQRVSVLATIDRRAGEVRDLADSCGWRLALYRAAELAGQPVRHPSAAVAALAGTPSVAEAAALLAAGPAARLIVAKQVFPGVTVAVGAGGLHSPCLADGHSCTGMFSCISGR